jgi:hypothetical protein
MGSFGKSHFFGRKSLNWSNLVNTYRNSLVFLKLNKEHELDAKIIIKWPFKELLAFLSKKMTIFDNHMVFGKYKKIFQWKPFFSLQIWKEHEILYKAVLKESWLLNWKVFKIFVKKWIFLGW